MKADSRKAKIENKHEQTLFVSRADQIGLHELRLDTLRLNEARSPWLG